MSKLLSVSKAAQVLGVSPNTLRRWESEGRLIPEARTLGNQRRYSLRQLTTYQMHKPNSNTSTVAYARVSSKDQAKDLERQAQLLELYCSSNGWSYELIKDLGSGINYRKKGLKTLINKIVDGEIGRLVLTHKDRLLRFGAELIFALCEARGVEIVILNQSEDSTFEEDLAKDVLEIITIFSARLYGSRSHKNKKLLEKMQEAALEN